MKKLVAVAVGLAMVLSFLPKAEAGDTAELGLTVTFRPNEPLKIRSEPEGPFEIKEAEELVFRVFAEDPDTSRDVSIEARDLPRNATFVMDEYRMPSPQRFAAGTFRWVPETGQAQSEPYVVTFVATNGEGVLVRLGVEITVNEARISIELVDSNGHAVNRWDIANIALGGLKDNTAGSISGPFQYLPLHNIRNDGGIAVDVDMGYVLNNVQDVMPNIAPGKEQGIDTFITGHGRAEDHTVINPGERLLVLGGLDPGELSPLWLTYGAPTGVSGLDLGHDTRYELRAYPAVWSSE